MQDTDVEPNASQPQDALHIENEVIKTEEKILKGSLFKANASQPPRVRKDTEGLYLDDVLSLTPSEANLYLQGVPKDNQVGKETSEPPASPHASDFDSGTDSQTQDDQTYGPCLNDEVMMSLCGLPSASTEPQSDKFQEKLVTYDQFAQNAVSILNDPNLVVKFGDQYLTWQNAVPVITAMAVFKKPIDVKSIERLIQPSNTPPPQGSRLMGWLWRRPKSES
uniref:Lipin middle domain-containing protein n=1 Tax=Ciona savignyi TaxID=51511 RepID=H2YZF3_CIOSA